ncbi:MAG: hypothetical protein JSU70_20985 [Phycisphaerales bacterium]|nr:MAG: hypothetical protein JSU70_20985 [Phycisphaerales bacterium]
MNDLRLLLNAYHEALHEQLAAQKDRLTEIADQLLREEVAKRGFGAFDAEELAAYRDACLAFVDERLEAYNPVGIQYTFDRIRSPEAAELELQLNWYDGRAEFATLLAASRAKVETGLVEQRLELLADELIKELGAFPDGSIISAYEADPAPNKLPDYVVARAIEQIIGRND